MSDDMTGVPPARVAALMSEWEAAQLAWERAAYAGDPGAGALGAFARLKAEQLKGARSGGRNGMMDFVGLCDACRSSGVPTIVVRGRAVCGDCYVACRHEEGRPA